MASVVHAAGTGFHDWLGTVSIFTRWATECSKHTTQQISPRPLAFTQALTTLTKPPAFFTPRAVPQCTTVQAQWQAEAGLCSCCPCPVSPCHWPASQQIWFSGTGTDTVTKPHSEPCINKSKRVLLACMLLLRIWFRVGTVNAWPRVTQHRLVLWHLLSTFFCFVFGKQAI